MAEKPFNIDDLLRIVGNVGSLKQAVTNNVYGINFTKGYSPIPYNQQDVGYIFFTRPQLNLTTGNIRAVRKLYPLLTQNELTVQRFSRVTLDPRLPYDPFSLGDLVDCPLVDRQQAFIPVLTNAAISASGWPSIVLPTFSSEPGIRREQYSQADGFIEYYEQYDIDITFRNDLNSPIVMLFWTWLTYMASVFEGIMVPYPDMIYENEIDYNTRIYRLVMDKNRRRVNMIFATGAAFPLNVPTGQFFDYTEKVDYKQQTQNVTVQFRCMGAEFNDEILIREFNETVGIFHPGMRQLNDAKLDGRAYEGEVKKVPREFDTLLNYRVYPFIDYETHELEWYAPTRLVDAVTKLFQPKQTEIITV